MQHPPLKLRRRKTVDTNMASTIPSPKLSIISIPGSSTIVRIPRDEWRWASPEALTVRPPPPAEKRSE